MLQSSGGLFFSENTLVREAIVFRKMHSFGRLFFLEIDSFGRLLGGGGDDDDGGR